ncbi:Flp family type IVb pilin [Halomonas cerina]|uniref:Flp pilus assembly pilin Flp n=1 Tax=Halomonas cerina TaxID=447424 RepID=A0A839V9M2_9GAMM|nr:hypothetical protein [Halomonas cerina]MBB3189246.1 Flp pilus assembly pilin Flp [Halomonas cerina]
MNKLMQGIERFWKEEEGTETVEWALVAGLIVAGAAAVFTLIGTNVERVMTLINGELDTVQ